MKPGRKNGNKSQDTRMSLEEIKEERNANHDVEDEDPNIINERNANSAKKSPSKVPRGMKSGSRVNPNRELMTQAQRAEKYYELLEENTRLKTHQTELDEDIKKMAARLKRIKELISKERKLAGGILGNEFDKELDLIIDENTQLKSEKKKFETLAKSLQAQIKKGGIGKQAGKGYGVGKAADIAKEQDQLIGKLKEQLKHNMKTIESLKEEILLLRKGKPESEPSREIIQRIQDNDNEIVRLKWSLQEVTSNYEGLNAVLDRWK